MAEPAGVQEMTSVNDSDVPMRATLHTVTDVTDEKGVAGGMDEMNPEIAEYWDLWSAQIGRAVHPLLLELNDELTSLTSAMVCTADGFNLCSVGLDEAQVARLSALASSLYSVSGAASQVTQGAAPTVDILDMVSLHHGTSQTVVVSVSGLIIGNVLLWVTADSETLGVMLVATKSAAKRLADLLTADS